ncbi:MAG: hypothetical protein ABIJ96_02095 [Elusimicrobiota bacterium]
MTGWVTFALSLVWGVNTLFLLRSGLGLFGLFFVYAAFAAAAALAEIPAGAAADVWGRRRCLLFALAVLAAGTLLYALVGLAHGGVFAFTVVSLLLGLGAACLSGTLEAWAVDALRESGDPHPLEYVFAQASVYSGAGLLAGLVTGGLLGSLHLALPYLVRTAVLAAAAYFAWGRMRDIGFTPKTAAAADFPAEVRKAMRAALFFGWQDKQLRWLLAASALQAAFLAWGYRAWQPYFLGMLAGSAPWIASLIAAAVATAVMAGNAAVRRCESWCGRRTTLLLCAAAVFGIAAVGVGAAGGFGAALAYYLLAMAALGVYAPVKQAYLHAAAPAEFRATVASFDSFVSGGAEAAGHCLLGGVAKRHSLDFGYVVGGFIALLCVPVLLMLRRSESRADVIKKHAAGDSPQAAVGHPVVC